ncbi:hypothetical protein KUV28_02350 [Ferrimonas balearica]|nr:hypothetical protein [Ferrimonas balearica]
MLELISVVALAAIGVAFTSYQGDRESTSIARRSAVQDAEDQAEPVGIFGHDVGRRLRDSMRFWNRSEEDQQALDEAEALAARLSATLEQDDETGDEAEAAQEEVPADPDRTGARIEDVVHQQGWDHDVTDGEVDAVLAAEPDLTDDGYEAPLEEAWASSLGTLVAEMETGEEDDAPVAGAQDDLLPDDPEPEATPEPPTEAAARAPLNAPVIRDFDPERDQIVLEYRPEDAGNGRVGITSDDRHPGAALITLGGKVVAIVEGGEGQVTAAHVELVQENTQDTAAA